MAYLSPYAARMPFREWVVWFRRFSKQSGVWEAFHVPIQGIRRPQRFLYTFCIGMLGPTYILSVHTNPSIVFLCSGVLGFALDSHGCCWAFLKMKNSVFGPNKHGNSINEHGDLFNSEGTWSGYSQYSQSDHLPPGVMRDHYS